MKEGKLMIYGAYGYSGELMAREAVKQGIKPIIAGRTAEKLMPLAHELGLEYKVFTVQEAAPHLHGISVLLNCAGPFSATTEALVKACLVQHVHYLDITGEIEVFRKCYALDDEARRQNILVIPGVGTDIVPTDCLAAMLKEKLPAATAIDLAFSFGTQPSIGTLKTFIENLGKGGLIRENNRLKTVPNAFRIRKIPFQNRPQWAATIPWGDVFTAGISTRVPNGMVYMAMSKTSIYMARLTNPLKGIINSRFGQDLTKGLLDLFIKKGPDQHARENQRGQFWGEARAQHGDRVAMTMSTPNVYSLTVIAGIKIARYCLGNHEQNGYQTPSLLVGSDFINSIPGIDIRIL